MSNDHVASPEQKAANDELLRVLYDDVEFDDQLALVGGKPFTGVIFALHPGGQPEAELNYREGLPEGLQQEWYANGQLERKWIAVRGKGSSEAHEWYVDGAPKSFRRNIDLWPVEIKEWDGHGNLVVDERRSPPN